ncbi:heme exporter protein CcmD [Shimwellia blattae]|uniref:Heme exporter protein D n=1 Tax=Shimwellia blattae (strain ATCC 29907 / DSM 4481 / JCM 1650 / NBRC 105725 / CDC 9005-74) TaxID=630626 RepID=I2BC54_SHIBC|nr:heme exporter protein CcmD [Shimwellia blattae]AFJ48108.1 cytochrome c-type biogenesis protein CcmD [Shimwellia blattae DSM 4481 = NBRC 105725]GAB81905.1 heme ABC transporter holo-CcmE release factor [Shimwellia blattae DSM 4481 = NBRC 105725]VDY65607.1 Cytochrome c-type biogenesis protein CcmD [Shimwellia blattae]VEC25080.1 Cytochrome c-type biogenesis protein CcmD [Shimwellia blattae]
MTPAFASFSAFLAMGGYGFYVWLSLGVTLLALLVLLAHSALQRRRILADIRRHQARERRIRAARESQSVSGGYHARTP